MNQLVFLEKKETDSSRFSETSFRGLWKTRVLSYPCLCHIRFCSVSLMWHYKSYDTHEPEPLLLWTRSNNRCTMTGSFQLHVLDSPNTNWEFKFSPRRETDSVCSPKRQPWFSWWGSCVRTPGSVVWLVTWWSDPGQDTDYICHQQHIWNNICSYTYPVGVNTIYYMLYLFYHDNKSVYGKNKTISNI